MVRAKTLDDEWAEGYLVREGVHAYLIVKTLSVYSDGTDQQITAKIVEVDSSTICRRVGLKDKNGSDLWENDIVSVMMPSGMHTGKIIFGSVDEVNYGFSIQWTNQFMQRSEILRWLKNMERKSNTFD